jgi:hypothetical protein
LGFARRGSNPLVVVLALQAPSHMLPCWFVNMLMNVFGLVFVCSRAVGRCGLACWLVVHGPMDQGCWLGRASWLVVRGLLGQACWLRRAGFACWVVVHGPMGWASWLGRAGFACWLVVHGPMGRAFKLARAGFASWLVLHGPGHLGSQAAEVIGFYFSSGYRSKTGGAPPTLALTSLPSR